MILLKSLLDEHKLTVSNVHTGIASAYVIICNGIEGFQEKYCVTPLFLGLSKLAFQMLIVDNFFHIVIH